MEITDVRVKLIEKSGDRLKAVCTVTFDGEFVVRDVKVVQGSTGLFVAMPSRKMSVPCPSCRHKNVVRARFCNECGAELPDEDPPQMDQDGRGKLHRDVAHPITAPFRAMLQERVIAAYEEEAGAEADYEVDEDEGMSPPSENFEEDVEDNRGNRIEDYNDSDEYSAMIAGLRSGENRGQSRGPRRDGGRDGGRGGAQRGGRPDNRRGGGQRREGQRGGQSREANGNRRSDGDQRSGSGSGTRGRRDGGGSKPRRQEAPAAQREEGNRGPAPRERAREEAPAKVTPATSGPATSVEDDEDDAFGEGLF